MQIYLSQIPYENLRTNELSLCSLFSNNCTYQRRPSVVFVLLSFRETDHIQASWEVFNYENKSLLTRYEMKEQTIGLFSFVSPTLDTLGHKLPSVSSLLLCCFFVHSFMFSCSHFCFFSVFWKQIQEQHQVSYCSQNEGAHTSECFFMSSVG